MKNIETVGLPSYQPEIWKVQKDLIYASIHAVKNGIQYLEMCIIDHDQLNGRTTIKNKRWAESMEKDLAHMKTTLNALCKTNNPPL